MPILPENPAQNDLFEPLQIQPVARSHTFKHRPSANERYRRYMRSATWAELRVKSFEWNFEVNKGFCALCLRNPATQVHHLRYPKVWGTEPLKTLLCLCAGCHKSLHGPAN